MKSSKYFFLPKKKTGEKFHICNSGFLSLNRMNIVLVSSVLGVAVFSLHVAALEEPIVSVWPPGSEIYLGEHVLLQCRVESNSTYAWTYHWYRNMTNTALTLNLRPLVSGDSYSIMAVTREDAGSYWCRAEQRESNITTEVEVVLDVSDGPPPSLTLTPSSRQIFSEERLTIHCPAGTNSTHWELRHFLPGQPDSGSQTCFPLGGAVGADQPCAFIADGGNSGLYWCEGSEGRSSSVNLTVSYGNIILKTPAFPVYQGDKVVLYCQYRTANHKEAMFFKNGKPINTSETVFLSIENVTQKHEGLYKCASQDRKMESPESWLSVLLHPGNFTSKEEAAANDLWTWIVVSCVAVLLLLISLTVWLVWRSRYRTFHTQSCWPFFKEDIPAVPLPATKQDVTEVQWDLSWMEMSSLLDKQSYPGT